MNAPLPRLPSNAPKQRETSAEDRRREPRRTVGHPAWIETAQGARIDVRLVDASLHGCCVMGTAGRVRQGAFIGIGLGDDEPLEAVVRWVRGETAGMEFLRTVPASAGEWQHLVTVSG